MVLVDPDGAVLLLSGVDPDHPDGPTWWHVPGGGVETGESLVVAARRELEEETGRSIDHPGPVVWRRRVQFRFAGLDIDQSESFFVVRSPRFVPVAAGWTELEHRSLLGWRWWSPRDLAQTAETVFPPGLGGLLAEWHRVGPAAQPPWIP